jgi:hypothetical protein
MANAELPSTWADAAQSALGNSLWMLPLVAIERLVAGELGQAGILGVVWLVAIAVAVKLHVLQNIISSRERQLQLLTWALIICGAAILGTGLYRLGAQQAFPGQEITKTVVVHDPATAEDIAKATAPIQAKLDAANQQLAQKEAELQRAKQPVIPVPPAADTPRVYTNKTVQDLAAFYKDRTPMQGDVFMADEKGKWINTEGKLQTLMPNGRGAALYNGDYQILCNFGEKWKAKLGALQPSAFIKIAGKISQDQWAPPSLFLEECELRD